MDKATELLARYATALRFEDLPPEVVHDAKRKLIDTLGCAIGAFDEEPCRIAHALASRCVGPAAGAHLRHSGHVGAGACSVRQRRDGAHAGLQRLVRPTPLHSVRTVEFGEIPVEGAERQMTGLAGNFQKEAIGETQ
ncbi:MAG: MmgE/PrpD family protein [Burkholderiales bacterium]